MGVWRSESNRINMIIPRFPMRVMRYIRVNIMKRGTCNSGVSVSPKSLNSFTSVLFSLEVILKLCFTCQNKRSKMDKLLMHGKWLTAYQSHHDAITSAGLPITKRLHLLTSIFQFVRVCTHLLVPDFTQIFQMTLSSKYLLFIFIWVESFCFLCQLLGHP